MLNKVLDPLTLSADVFNVINAAEWEYGALDLPKSRWGLKYNSPTGSKYRQNSLFNILTLFSHHRLNKVETFCFIKILSG